MAGKEQAAVQRIVFVTHSAAESGAELLLQRLLAGQDVGNISVILLEEGPLVSALRKLSVDVRVVPMGTDVATFRREDGLWSALRRARPVVTAAARLGDVLDPEDLVVALSQKAFLIACLARLRSRFRLVWWLHDILTRDHFSSLSIRTGVALSRVFCEAIITPSPEVRAAFVAAGGSRDRSLMIEPGIELERFGHPAPPPQVDPRILNVSRLTSWKGQATLLEALPDLPGLECQIAGAPLFGQEAYECSLRDRAAALGLADRVRFLGHCDDVPALMREGGIFVHVPTAPEPFGQVVIEAMASGMPIVVSDIGAPARIVDESFGCRVPPDDPRALAAVLRALVEDPLRRAEMSTQAQAVAARYGIDAARKAFFAALRDIAARKAPAVPAAAGGSQRSRQGA